MERDDLNKSEDELKFQLRKDILNTFQQQFSANQNHNQKLFIQFFSAVLVIIAAYAFVYIFTTSDSDDFFVKEVSSGTHTLYYSLSHLIGSYVIAQIILIFLGALILNIGYGFRRDQKITALIFDVAFENNTRNSHSEAVEKFITAIKSFTPLNKGLLKNSFLPTFNAMFFNFIVLVQVLLLSSIVFTFVQTKSTVYNLFQEHFVISLLVFSIPVFISLLEYVRYYIKYKVRIDEDASFKGAKFNEIFSILQELFQIVPILLAFDYYLQPSPSSLIFRICALVILIACIITGIVGVVRVQFQSFSFKKRTHTH